MNPPRVLVLGGGVSGLTCAVRIAETQRFDVTLIAEKLALESLSRVAGASFYPHHVRHPRLDAWLAASLAEFRALAGIAGSGVRMRPALEVGTPGQPPFDAALLPCTWQGDAWRFETAVMDVPTYLPWLVARFERAGGRVRRERVASLDDLCAGDAIVVNCSGSEARALVRDPRVQPTLGHIVRIESNGIDELRLDPRAPSRPTYVVPREHDAVLGSIDLPWDADARGFEPPAADPAVTADVVERCVALDARVRGARVLDAYCGLRPVRDEVRLEIDEQRRSRGARVVHDYGHGGAGVTLSWGCANDVLRRVLQLAD